MINVYLNDKQYQVISNLSLDTLLASLKSKETDFAIAINNEFIPRLSYASTFLHENDRIDFIVPMQGG